MSKTYNVTGMTCQGCARSVTNAITRALPGTHVRVDLQKGEVQVDAPGPGPDDAAVRKAVEGAGFGFAGPGA